MLSITSQEHYELQDHGVDPTVILAIYLYSPVQSKARRADLTAISSLIEDQN